MKHAYCSECGAYVPLSAGGMCPRAHPATCYSNIGEIDFVGMRTATQMQAQVLASDRGASPWPATLPVPPRRFRWWLVWLGAVAVLLAAAGAAAVLIVLPRLSPALPTARSGAPRQGLSAEDASGTVVASATPDGAMASVPATVAVTPENQHLWALAVSAMLTEMNRESHDTLAGCALTEANVTSARQGLAQWWGIGNKEDLLEMLAWIESGGHRAEFAELYKVLGGASKDEIAEYKANYHNNAELLNRIDVVLSHGGELGAEGIIGWDYVRYIFLCRRGYLCGYLTEQEAWDRIMPVARMLQTTFTSWDDLGENYLIGREFWSYTQTKANGALLQEIHDDLLTDPGSPWVTLPWDFDLSPVAVPAGL